MATLAVLGTGLLGAGFVENLLAKGQQVRIWNRSPAKLAPLCARGAVAARDPADAVRGAERVHLVLAEDDAVDAVIAALRPGLGAGVPVLDHSTNLPARVAARYALLRRDGIRYLHAPVFTSPQNAREASGLMVLAGDKAECEALRPALEAMTGKVWHAGERPDLAAFHKLAGNGVLMAMTAIMGDLLALGRACDVGREQVFALFDVFKPGAALPFLGQRVAGAGAGAPSFELQMARKDVRLMLSTAAAPSGRPLVALPAIAAAMDRALAEGRAHADFAVFARSDRD
jgi:3-hydroxyisobutyrate dehydrogenase-like beta-hydroxyacid dehydrogenase